MPPFPSLTHIPMSILWVLLGLPLSVFAGAAWDGMQPPDDTQQFLGASNNYLMLWLLPFILRAVFKELIAALRGRSDHPWLAPVLFALLGWAVYGQWANDAFATGKSSALPIVALLLLTAGVFLHMDARAVVRAGHAGALTAITAWSLGLTALGIVFAVVVNLSGPMTMDHPFLRVDGFANIRTLGEASLLGLAVGLALNARRFAAIPFVLAVVLAMILVWSGTRASWVGLGATLAVGAVWWAVPLAGVARWIAAIALGTALSTLLPLPDSNYGAFRAVSLVTEATTVATDVGGAVAQPDAVDTEASESNRLSLWTWGVDRIAESPLVGRGYGAMGSIPDKPKHAAFKHLHNLPLDLMFGFGVPIGLALTAVIAWIALQAMHRSRGTDHLLLPMIACGTLVNSLFAGLFLFPISVVAVALGLAIAAQPRHPTDIAVPRN